MLDLYLQLANLNLKRLYFLSGVVLVSGGLLLKLCEQLLVLLGELIHLVCVVFFETLPLHHDIVHLCLNLSNLELKMALLMLIALDKLGLHRLELLFGPHQFLCELFSQTLLSFEGCCHFIIVFFQFSALPAQILVDPFELLHDGHVLVGIVALHPHALKLVLVVYQLGLLLEQLVFHLFVLALPFLHLPLHLLRLSLLRLVSLGAVGKLIPQFIEIKGQFSILILCLAVQDLFLLYVIPELPAVLLELIDLGENLILLAFELVALIDGRIELVEQDELLIVDSAVSFSLLCPDLREQPLVLPLLAAQLLAQLVYFIQKGPILPLPFGIAHWAEAKPQWLVALYELRFLSTVVLHLYVVHPLQRRLQLFLHFGGTQEGHHFFVSRGLSISFFGVHWRTESHIGLGVIEVALVGALERDIVEGLLVARLSEEFRGESEQYLGIGKSLFQFPLKLPRHGRPLVFGEEDLSEVEIVNGPSLLAGVAAAERVEEDGDIGGEGGGLAVPELDLHAGLEALVELDVLHPLVDAVLLAGGLLLAALPPELHVAGEVELEVDAVHLQLELVVQALHLRFK